MPAIPDKNETWTLPHLAELMAVLAAAFEHHLEILPGPDGGLVLRMAGREFLLRGVDEDAARLRRLLCSDFAEVAGFGLATALVEESVPGTRMRMDLVSALATLEATASSRAEPQADGADRFLTTAEAATRLGMSRPHVSMLCNQGKLGEVARSQGGHRRIRQSAVEAYRLAHVEPGASSATRGTEPCTAT